MAKSPYSEEDDEALEKGERVARARYWTDIRNRANEIIFEHKEYGTEINDLIHQAADNAVIYTKHALDILVESENYTASDDHVGELPDEVGNAITQMAYYAFFQDLTEAVQKKADAEDIEINPSNGGRRASSKKRAKRRTKKTTRRRN